MALLKYSKYEKEGQLYDALATGCRLPYADHSLDHYGNQVERDIVYLVKADPELLKYNGGTLRCRHDVTPLAIACFNENIPTHIVDLLLEKGANPHETIKVNGYTCDLLDDLEGCLSKTPERYVEIKKIFDKYRTSRE